MPSACTGVDIRFYQQLSRSVGVEGRKWPQLPVTTCLYGRRIRLADLLDYGAQARFCPVDGLNYEQAVLAYAEVDGARIERVRTIAKEEHQNLDVLGEVLRVQEGDLAWEVLCGFEPGKLVEYAGVHLPHVIPVPANIGDWIHVTKFALQEQLLNYLERSLRFYGLRLLPAEVARCIEALPGERRHPFFVIDDDGAPAIYYMESETILAPHGKKEESGIFSPFEDTIPVFGRMCDSRLWGTDAQVQYIRASA
jgi:hypothetical protein